MLGCASGSSAGSEPQRAVLSSYDRAVGATLRLVVDGLEQLVGSSVDDQYAARLVDGKHLAVGIYHIARLVVGNAVGALDVRSHLVGKQIYHVHTICGAQIAFLQIGERQECTSVGCHNIATCGNVVNLCLNFKSLGIAHGECGIVVVGLSEVEFLAHNVHVAVGNGGIASGGAQLCGAGGGAQRQAIMPLATLVEIVDGGTLFAEVALVEHEHTIGVFCLLCPVIAANGPAIIGSLAMVLLAAYICYIIHMAVVYSLTVKAIGGMSPLDFFKNMFPAMIFAFSSSSSVGTLPINMECVEKMGVSKEVSSFVLPLGATINMDGTAIYQGVCAIFIASCYGIQLTLPQMLTIILTATLASIGTAGVPGAGMVMLAMVLTSVGLPVDGIALVAGVDRIFDMGRTVVNITGDASCCVVVHNLEKKKEMKKN